MFRKRGSGSTSDVWSERILRALRVALRAAQVEKPRDDMDDKNSKSRITQTTAVKENPDLRDKFDSRNVLSFEFSPSSLPTIRQLISNSSDWHEWMDLRSHHC